MINHILYHNGISYTFLTMTIIIGYHNIYFKYDNIKHGKFNDSTNIAYSFTRGCIMQKMQSIYCHILPYLVFIIKTSCNHNICIMLLNLLFFCCMISWSSMLSDFISIAFLSCQIKITTMMVNSKSISNILYYMYNIILLQYYKKFWNILKLSTLC